MRVNIVTGWGVDWVFADLIDRLRHFVKADVVVTERPLDGGRKRPQAGGRSKRRAQKRPQADVFHFWRPQAAVGVEDLSRAVLTCHGLGYWAGGERGAQGRPIYGPQVIEAFRRAAAAIVLNSGDEQELQRHGLSQERIHGIPHAVDPEVFALRREHDPASKLVIGRVGRPYGPPDDPHSGVECKGRATLHEIMQGLKRHGGQIKWLFLGQGWEHEHALAQRLGFESMFIARTQRSYPDGFVAAYHEMDVFLVTSRAEGGPASLPEAMACRVWPVCTPVGMCADLIRPGLNGELYPVNCHEAATGQLEALLEDRERLEQQRQAVRASVLSLTWSRWAEAHRWAPRCGPCMSRSPWRTPPSARRRQHEHSDLRCDDGFGVPGVPCSPGCWAGGSVRGRVWPRPGTGRQGARSRG